MGGVGRNLGGVSRLETVVDSQAHKPAGELSVDKGGLVGPKGTFSRESIFLALSVLVGHFGILGVLGQEFEECLCAHMIRI